MLDFIFIITIFFEIVLTVIAIIAICKLEQKVKILNSELFLIQDIILKINSQLKPVITNTNKVVSIFTNKKFIQISKIIALTIDTIQIIILLRSLNLSRGVKALNFETLKKLFMAQITKTIIRKLSGCSI